MGLRVDMTVTLLAALLLMTYICEAALLRKSTAVAFLRSPKDKRSAECFHAGCSMEDSEAEELLEANSDYEDSSQMQLNGVLEIPGGETLLEEGSGM